MKIRFDLGAIAVAGGSGRLRVDLLRGTERLAECAASEVAAENRRREPVELWSYEGQQVSGDCEEQLRP